VVSVAYKWLAKWSKGPYASLGADN
jgi:hypothetical protein